MKADSNTFKSAKAWVLIFALCLVAFRTVIKESALTLLGASLLGSTAVHFVLYPFIVGDRS